MRLKGKMLDKLSPRKREKMERTLKRMEEVRRNDDMRLRNLIQSKKEWAVDERKVGFNVIDELDGHIEEVRKESEKRIEEIVKQQDEVRTQIIRLDGVLLALNDLLFDCVEQDEELKKQRVERIEKAEAVRKAAEEETRIIAEKKAEEKALKDAEKSKKPKTVRKTTSKAKTRKDMAKK